MFTFLLEKEQHELSSDCHELDADGERRVESVEDHASNIQRPLNNETYRREAKRVVVTIPRWRKLVAQCPNRQVRKGLQRNGIFQCSNTQPT